MVSVANTVFIFEVEVEFCDEPTKKTKKNNKKIAFMIKFYV